MRPSCTTRSIGVYSCGTKPCRERDPLRHITTERSREDVAAKATTTATVPTPLLTGTLNLMHSYINETLWEGVVQIIVYVFCLLAQTLIMLVMYCSIVLCQLVW